MGVVIGFPQYVRAHAPPREKGEPAQILFFTGVRYQRMSEAPGEHDGQSPSREGGKRRRKRG